MAKVFPQYSDDEFKSDVPHNGRTVIDVSSQRYGVKTKPLPPMPGSKKKKKSSKR